MRLFDSGPERGLFGPDVDLAQLGLSYRQLAGWWNDGLLSFNPTIIDRLERWQFEEAVFLRDLTAVEWSLNALRKILASLPRPYAISSRQMFFDFRSQTWRRMYEAKDLMTASADSPERVGEVTRVLIRVLAFFGAREEIAKTKTLLDALLS
jgi:hypothetical protein